jgi:hypothetical protein
MTDNVTLNAGSGGAVLATDDVSGVHYQINKLAYGALDTATLVTTTNRLPVDVAATVVEDVASTGGETLMLAGAIRSDSANTTAGTNGDYTPLLTDANGRLHVIAAFTASQNIATIGTSITPGGSAAHLGKAVDAVAGATDTGVALLAVRDDALAALTPVDGDYTHLRVNANGAQWVMLDAGGTVNAIGPAAHDAAISGNPVRMAGRALTSDYTAVAAGDTADLITTLTGKLVTIPYANPANTWNYAAAAGGLVNTTGVSAKAAAGASIRNYVTKVSIVNSHATISTEVVIRDGAAGTVLWRGWAQAAGGGQVEKLDPPLRGTANTLIEIAEVTATATTGVLVNLQGFSAAE